MTDKEMKITIVKCALGTRTYTKGNTSTFERTLTLIEEGSYKGSFDIAMDHMINDTAYFLEEIAIGEEGYKDGEYDLQVMHREGGNEYPESGWVSYSLKKTKD